MATDCDCLRLRFFVSDRDSPSTDQRSRKLRPPSARGECADDEREPLIPTPAYPLSAARFGFAGDNCSPNLSRTALRIRREPISRGDATRTLQMLVVPRDERTLALLSNSGV